MRPYLALAAIVAIGFSAMSCGGNPEMLLTGRVVLFDDVTDIEVSFSGDTADGARGRSCRGTGGYDDFGPGMNVTIRDEDGAIIASTQTEPWYRLERDHPDYNEIVEAIDDTGLPTVLVSDSGLYRRGTLGLCHVWWVASVPVTDFYEVNVGRRGTLSYSLPEIEDAGWVVATSLGYP